ncbi:MAG: type II toxin-antitoxin system Phd/YefM family antitoxin [Propionibacteriaceae bacterium]|nr:type II toxin-antitoxin system Phd/YefM family antitoxin [Propionibacteriaceae bacterium]
MLTDTRDLVSVTEASRAFSRLTQEVADGRTVVVLKNNEPAMAMVPMDVVEGLTKVGERESDVRLLALALARTFTDDGVRYDLDSVLAEAGVTQED